VFSYCQCTETIHSLAYVQMMIDSQIWIQIDS
jgi:hypothetical protein